MKEINENYSQCTVTYDKQRSSSIPNALLFGNHYAGRRFIGELQALYPEGIYTFNRWTRRFSKYGRVVQASKILGGPCTILQVAPLTEKELKDLPFDLVLVHPGPVEAIYRVSLHDE